MPKYIWWLLFFKILNCFQGISILISVSFSLNTLYSMVMCWFRVFYHGRCTVSLSWPTCRDPCVTFRDLSWPTPGFVPGAIWLSDIYLPAHHIFALFSRQDQLTMVSPRTRRQHSSMRRLQTQRSVYTKVCGHKDLHFKIFTSSLEYSFIYSKTTSKYNGMIPYQIYSGYTTCCTNLKQILTVEHFHHVNNSLFWSSSPPWLYVAFIESTCVHRSGVNRA